MNHNAYRNTHLVCLGVRNVDINRVEMLVCELLMLVEELILCVPTLCSLPEPLAQGLLQSHLHIDTDTQGFFGVQSG